MVERRTDRSQSTNFNKMLDTTCVYNFKISKSQNISSFFKRSKDGSKDPVPLLSINMTAKTVRLSILENQNEHLQRELKNTLEL